MLLYQYLHVMILCLFNFSFHFLFYCLASKYFECASDDRLIVCVDSHCLVCAQDLLAIVLHSVPHNSVLNPSI